MATTCASRGCVAVVAVEGAKCAVHRRATQGPHSWPCEGCGKPITAHDLWVQAPRPDRPQDAATRPWHYACRPSAPKAVKRTRAKREWDAGLGLFDGGAR